MPDFLSHDGIDELSGFLVISVIPLSLVLAKSPGFRYKIWNAQTICNRRGMWVAMKGNWMHWCTITLHIHRVRINFTVCLPEDVLTHYSTDPERVTTPRVESDGGDRGRLIFGSLDNPGANSRMKWDGIAIWRWFCGYRWPAKKGAKRNRV